MNNQRNNIEDIDSSNDDEEINNDRFINKKELVHIENDTSINVDKSFDDDHSKTSTLKKGFMVNNISSINEQFSQGIDLCDKKITDINFFTKHINEESNDFNDTEKKLKATPLTNYRKKTNEIQINSNNYFENFNNEVDRDESNNINNYKVIRKMNINNINNYTNSNNENINNKKNENFSIYSFNHNYIGVMDNINLNQNGDSNISNLDFQNKYNQLESKYFLLNNQYKKLKSEFQELNNSNKSVLDLLSYWQKFYLEIKEIVYPEKVNNNNEMGMNDYMDDPYRTKVIEEVKKIIKISKDKVYNNFYKTPIINFSFINKINNNILNINKWNNLQQNKGESFIIKKSNSEDILDNLNNLKISKKFLDESDELDFLPLKYPEKINIGVNTDTINSNYNKNNNLFFPSEKLIISKKIHKLNFFEIINNKSKSNINKDNLRTKKLISCPSGININNKSRQKEFEIISIDKLIFKGKPNMPLKFKKNVMYKIARIQTDITKDNMDQLLLSQKEKEKIQKQYEEKINSLNNYIKNNVDKNNNKIKITNYNNIKNTTTKNSPNKKLNNSKIFLPEMIPPEHTYKIFMNCIKNFKYEEGIYQKYIEEDDLYIMKSFVEKMEKCIMGTSLPILKANKRKDYVVNTRVNNESSVQKKYKEKILSGNKYMFININNQKKRNISESKNYDDRSNSAYNINGNFNKYKATILSQKHN